MRQHIPGVSHAADQPVWNPIQYSAFLSRQFTRPAFWKHLKSSALAADYTLRSCASSQRGIQITENRISR
jgi:hypothetical protein